MKFLILLLLPILGILFITSFHQADAKLLSDNVYLLQGNGFVITKDSIEDSEIDFEIATDKLVNGRMKITLEDAVVSFSNNDYVSSEKWQGTGLRDSRFLLFSGNAQNSNGDEISTNLLARLIDESKDGFVYLMTGKITKDNEVMKVVYTVKIVGTSTGTVEKPTTAEKPTQEKTIQINILSGSSNPGNKLNYYSLDTVTITPGTVIIWKNEDSVPHTILSGVASFSPGKPFAPDGKINSGDIAPGQTFKVTITDLGITRFFDSKYSWMDGVIISLPEKKSTSLGKNTETALDTRNKYLNKTGN